MTDDPRPGFNALRDKMLWHLKVHANAKPENLAEGLANMAFESLGCPGGTAVADERAAPDREAERLLFEARWPMPYACQWSGRGYSPTEYSAWEAMKHADRWDGWIARAALAAPKAEALQPIETAPMDREALLWSARDRIWSLDNWWRYCRWNGPQFTHWAPIPAPPAHQGATHHE